MPAIDTLVINAKDPTENKRKKNRKENTTKKTGWKEKTTHQGQQRKRETGKKGTEKEGSKN